MSLSVELNKCFAYNCGRARMIRHCRNLIVESGARQVCEAREKDFSRPSAFNTKSGTNETAPGCLAQSRAGALAASNVDAAPALLLQRHTWGPPMMLSNQSLLVVVLVGVIAGWLAGQIFRGTGFGLIGDLVVGLLGALFGSWLLPQLGLHLGTGIVAAIINATIGALIMLLIISLLRGPRWGGGWRSRW
jgi:uncharacterized membrane protein YeaQ/YmgE (transglycosylase-associated protein family)